MKILASGIEAHRSDFEGFPSDFVGPNGDTHSWRVMIAPYVFAGKGNADEFKKTFGYRLDAPWDCEHNRDAVAAFVWTDYTCPIDARRNGSDFTSYLMLVRPPAEEGQTARLPSNAVLIVESADCGIPHAEPKDIHWDDLWKDDSPFGKGKLNSFHSEVVKALRVDGKVIDIPKILDKQELRRLLDGDLND